MRGSALLAVQAVVACPPGGKLPPPEPGVRQRPVVDQAVLAVLNDFQVVVDRVAEHDPGLGTGGGEDQVLHLAAHPAGAGKADQVVNDAVVVIRSGIAGQGEQFGQLPVPYSPLDIAPLPLPRAVLALFLCREAEANAFLREFVGAHSRQGAGDRLTQHLGRQPVRQGRRRRWDEQVRQRFAAGGRLVQVREHPVWKHVAATAHADSFPASQANQNGLGLAPDAIQHGHLGVLAGCRI